MQINRFFHAAPPGVWVFFGDPSHMNQVQIALNSKQFHECINQPSNEGNVIPQVHHRLLLQTCLPSFNGWWCWMWGMKDHVINVTLNGRREVLNYHILWYHGTISDDWVLFINNHTVLMQHQHQQNVIWYRELWCSFRVFKFFLPRLTKMVSMSACTLYDYLSVMVRHVRGQIS